ncbi:MAG: purine-nucleoside phosphorylase, partial [Gammaproteobacteria bacterium]|nr:purine-nucleoside phosphorylase [Gammaproteobacteria bacterium]
YGPRFVPMDNAFDAKLREKFHAEAKARQIVLREGVYVGVLGPAYETPAEIRMFRILGGDLIGMSTVNETIVARHAGMKVVGLSAIANVAAGLSDQPVNHEEVLEFGQIASRKMATLLIHTLPQLKVE